MRIAQNPLAPFNAQMILKSNQCRPHLKVGCDFQLRFNFAGKAFQGC